MRKRVPAPVSGGIVLTCKCPSSCRHCIYSCGPGWEGDAMSREDLGLILASLSSRIMPAPHGPLSVDLNAGLHITGGEPFIEYDLMKQAVQMASALKIPSIFVETNCFWASDDELTRDRLRELKALGLNGIMISVNPFYLEHVPFERTERVVKAAVEVLGAGTMIYQLEYFKRMKLLDITGTVPYAEYLEMERKADFKPGATEFFMMGRAPYALHEMRSEDFPPIGAENFLDGPCPMPVARSAHNHFDNYGNYVPGFCAGLSYGDCRRLEELLEHGVDTEERPVLSLLMDEDMRGLMALALDSGYREDPDGYCSRCHLCADIRRYLALDVGGFPELQPLQYYRMLNP